VKKYCEVTPEADLTSDNIKQAFVKGMKDKTAALRTKLRKMTSVAISIYNDRILQEVYTLNLSK
jgi:hypothetical protein